ncbi:hypothetical protein L3Y34_002651 [Caenorhabditis briggsae]|uniref:Uncharacterized protein n=1 Tax=Caenorhabditis briggsae TaxID=6238 RepID=A0AAE9ISC2_CAEBR|nr:hypothetical protein L3Y34_002651 [Caenorhabditis briggsae]
MNLDVLENKQFFEHIVDQSGTGKSAVLPPFTEFVRQFYRMKAACVVSAPVGKAAQLVDQSCHGASSGPDRPPAEGDLRERAALRRNVRRGVWGLASAAGCVNVEGSRDGWRCRKVAELPARRCIRLSTPR